MNKAPQTRFGVRFAVAADVEVDHDDGHVTFRGDSAAATLSVGGAVARALARLGDGGAYEVELLDAVSRSDGPAAIADLYYVLDIVGSRRLLRVSVCHEDIPLITLTPTSPGFRLGVRAVVASRTYALSRFAYVRTAAGEVLLESPLAHSQVAVHNAQVLAILHLLARPSLLDDVCSAAAPALPRGVVEDLLAALLNSAMLVTPNGRGTSVQAELEYWEFHDLLFHARTRNGRHGAPLGATFRFAGSREPPPRCRPPGAVKPSIALPLPDLDRLRLTDPPFAYVHDARRSIRSYREEPITVRQLGEFLHRVARVTEMTEEAIDTGVGLVEMEFAWRPYPGGGALYELELYPIVQRCEGLAAGMYRFDPHEDRLEHICDGAATTALLADAGRAAGIAAGSVQVLIVIAARFDRMFWKYSGMAYAAILKDVGCLYQTMYLTATAMNLAPCALGSGDSEVFAAASGNTFSVEGSVGEFLLGSIPESDQSSARGRNNSGSAAPKPKYEPLSQASVSAPHAEFRRMREEDPVYWHPRFEAWFVSRYGDVATLARDTRFSAARQRRDGTDAPAELRRRLETVESFLARWLPLNDPPEHTRLRRLAAPVFTPEWLGQMRSVIEAEVGARLDASRDKGGLDIMADLAFPVATTTLARLLGVPATDIPKLKASVKDAMALVSARRATVRATDVSYRAVTQLKDYFGGLICDRGRHGKGTMWSVLAGSIDHDQETLAGLATVFLIGGYEPPAYQVGNAVLALLEDDETLRRLRRQPDLMAGASREFVRFDSAAMHLMRRANESLVLNGVPIPEHGMVIGLIHAANHDPEYFPEPYRVIVDRPPRRHFGFGDGIHACLGARLAELETQVVVRMLLDRYSRLELTATRLERVPSLTFHGLRSLPVIART